MPVTLDTSGSVDRKMALSPSPQPTSSTSPLNRCATPTIAGCGAPRSQGTSFCFSCAIRYIRFDTFASSLLSDEA